MKEGEGEVRGGWRKRARRSQPSLHFFPSRHTELGIDLPSILRKSAAVLTCRPRAAGAEAPDLGGPLLFAAALGAVHLLVRRG